MAYLSLSLNGVYRCYTVTPFWGKLFFKWQEKKCIAQVCTLPCPKWQHVKVKRLAFIWPPYEIVTNLETCSFWYSFTTTFYSLGDNAEYFWTSFSPTIFMVYGEMFCYKNHIFWSYKHGRKVICLFIFFNSLSID